MTDDVRDELVNRAIDNAIDRDRWRALYLHERKTGGECAEAHCPYRWSIWKQRAQELERFGTRLALAERALREISGGAEASMALAEWRAMVRELDG